jgi:hypothetical protein
MLVIKVAAGGTVRRDRRQLRIAEQHRRNHPIAECGILGGGVVETQLPKKHDRACPDESRGDGGEPRLGIVVVERQGKHRGKVSLMSLDPREGHDNCLKCC